MNDETINSGWSWFLLTYECHSQRDATEDVNREKYTHDPSRSHDQRSVIGIAKGCETEPQSAGAASVSDGATGRPAL